jgi:prepilin-type N-terminal cleavage/methylation domain-containing protein
MKNKISKLKGFTLVELLIVIALIAILSVAVLATINPIEQSNKARDARVQNDAAEVMNAYERYYASQQAYPWEYFTTNPVGAADAVMLRSDTYGFGICSGADNVAGLTASDANGVAADCDASDTFPNLLISSSELKSSFAGKDEFEPVRDATHPEYAMWTAKIENGNSIYVCYIPKANANRIDSTKMRCLNTDGVISKVGDGGCLATVADWDTAVTDGTSAMFRCVPE